MFNNISVDGGFNGFSHRACALGWSPRGHLAGGSRLRPRVSLVMLQAKAQIIIMASGMGGWGGWEL